MMRNSVSAKLFSSKTASKASSLVAKAPPVAEVAFILCSGSLWLSGCPRLKTKAGCCFIIIRSTATVGKERMRSTSQSHANRRGIVHVGYNDNELRPSPYERKTWRKDSEHWRKPSRIKTSRQRVTSLWSMDAQEWTASSWGGSFLKQDALSVCMLLIFCLFVLYRILSCVTISALS